MKNSVENGMFTIYSFLRGNQGENPKQSCCRDDGGDSQKADSIYNTISAFKSHWAN